MPKKVAVIGAGVTGLAAGVYARKAGHEVTVFEKGHKPGGLSTSWSRGGYTFEGGMHWMVGSSPLAQPLYQYWKEVGALRENNPIEVKDPVITLVGASRPLSLWRSPSRLRAELLTASPRDRFRIRLLSFDVYLLRLFQLLWCSHPLRYWLQLVLCLVPFLVRVTVLCLISVEKYVSRFRSDDIRTLLSSVICSEHNAASLIYTMASYSFGDSGLPEGGSTRVAGNIADTLLSLGGLIRYGCEVRRVEVSEGAVNGVMYVNPSGEMETESFDEVIVTSDTVKAIDKLFEKPITEKWAEKMRRDITPLECMFVCLGIEADLSAYSYSLRLVLDRPLSAGGFEYDWIAAYNYPSTDKGASPAPEGCSALTLMMYGDSYGYWAAAKADGSYEAKKKAVVDALIEIVSEKIPEAAGHIVVTDMSTPLTYERYCDTYRGSWMRVWRAGTLPPLVPATSRSVRGLHFAGQRTMLSGGLPVALQSGRRAALAIGK